MAAVRHLLILATLLLAFGQSEAGRVRVRWTPKAGIAVTFPRGDGYKFDRSAKKLYVCSGDVLNFYWSGETSGMHMFDGGKSDYDKCTINEDINFLKTENPSGSFLTKANNVGWRYYAYVRGLGKYDTKGGEGCKLKLAVYWSENC